MGSEYRNGTLDCDALGLEKYTTEFLKELQQTENDPPEIDTKIKQNKSNKGTKFGTSKLAHP
eukprot:6865007-Ditylum_brightwellii.AAC.1